MLFRSEGSFYPLHVLRDFVRCGVSGTPFEEALAQCEDCGSSCCTLYDGRHARGGGGELERRRSDGGRGGASVHSWQKRVRGACALEEVLLPSFVAQRWVSLIEQSSPPLAMRAWGNLFAMEKQAVGE